MDNKPMYLRSNDMSYVCTYRFLATTLSVAVTKDNWVHKEVKRTISGEYPGFLT